jgi:hypothetical protein
MTKLGKDGRVRFCGRCQQNVYNLIGMSREEAEKLLRESGSVCVRLFKRDDGTTITKDCGFEARGKIKLRTPPLEPGRPGRFGGPRAGEGFGAPTRRTDYAFPRFMGRVDLVRKEPPKVAPEPPDQTIRAEQAQRSRFRPSEKGRRREAKDDEA